MPLSFATPPKDGTAVVINGLQELVGVSRLGVAPALGRVGSQVMAPYPIYSLGLSDLPTIDRLELARPVGWCYLIVEGQSVVQMAEISQAPAGGGVSQLRSVTTGHAHEMEDAFHKAEALPEVANGDYEIRTLRVPALYLTALWLKSVQQNADRLLLVPPVYPPFNVHVVYDQNDFIKLLQTAAAKKLQQMAGP